MSPKRINKSIDAPKIHKDRISECRATRQTITFSFEYASDDKTFGIKKGKDKRKYCDLMSKLKIFSAKTWNEVIAQPRAVGVECISIGIMSERAQNALLKCKDIDIGEKVYIARIGDARLLMRRGTKCQRVAQILAIEWTLGDAYNH